jgi:glyoxylase-like metal-dependent hydrolase (beta-lactamase superfamily II)
VAVTHAHPDHVGAVDHYAGETGATVWAHADHVDRFVGATGVEPDRTFADGDAVGPARVVATPGHAPDHVCFRVGDDVCCGDLAVAAGSVVVGAPDGDVRAYLDSLRRVRDLAPARLYPGHGPVVDDPRATLDRLHDHRLDRERRILRAVREGADDVDAVLAAAYEKDLTGVEDLARATVVAHLAKLDADARVAFDADAGTVEPLDAAE